MSGLVACFDMQENEILFAQCIEGCFGLSLIVGVCQARGSFHLYDFESGIMADAAYQVNSRDNTSTFDIGIKLHQRLHGRAIASTPRPDTVCLFSPSLIERMVGQQCLTLSDQGVDEIGCGLRTHSSVVGLCISFFGSHEQRFP